MTRAAAAAAFAFASISAPLASAAVMEFQTGRDSTLIQNNSDGNYGGRNEVLIGATGSGQQRAGIVAWDVSSLAGQYISIDSMSVTFTIFRVAATTSWGINLLNESGVDWVEGTDTSGATQPGTVTWDFRQEGVLGTEWDLGGARGGPAVYGSMGTLALTDGVDVVNDKVTINLTAGSLPSNVDTLTEIMDLWTSGGNTGLGIYGGQAQWGLDSFQGSIAADRPLLTVNYTPVPEPTVACLGGLGLLGLLRRRRA
ncbi:MAG: hypothetical protein AAGI48_12685 [Verrucomicrobiota bacterium]